MEYYSAIKNEILPFATTWMDLEGIRLSEISQTKTNTVCYHLYVESKTNKQNKKPKLIEQIDGCHWQPWQNGWSKWSNDTDLIQRLLFEDRKSTRLNSSHT